MTDEAADRTPEDVPAESPKSEESSAEASKPVRTEPTDAASAPVVAEAAPVVAPAPAAPPAPKAATSSPASQAARAPAPTEPDADDEIWEAPEAANRVRPVPPSTPGSLPERRVVVIDEEAAVIGTDVSPKGGGSASERPEAIGATLHDDEGPRRRWRLFRKGGE